MSLKKSNQFPYSLPEFDNTKQKKIQRNPKITLENLLTNFDHSNFNSSILIQPCDRCHKQESLFKCFDCNFSQFCSVCNNQLHQYGKFLYHNRVLLSQLSYLKNMSGPEFFTPGKTKNEQELGRQMRIRKNKINISQTWNNIISQLRLKFQETMDVLENKKIELVLKLQTKRDQEIKSCEETISALYLNQSQNKSEEIQKKIKRSGNEKSSQAKLKFLAFQYDLLEKKFDRKYKLSLASFQEVQNTLNKLQLKNILTRSSLQIIPQTVKKPMKSSLICPLSPNSKNPLYEKSPLSSSTIEGTDKSNRQELSSKGILFEEIKLLSHVRSEKLFCKSPSNITKISKLKSKTRKQL